MLEKVGPIRLRHMLEQFGNPETILKASADRLAKVKGIGRDTAEAIADWENRIDLSKELERIDDYDCFVLTAADPIYPNALKEIYDPPIALYVQGTLEEKDHHGVAMVGSRMTTPYGLDTARKLAFQLAHAGVTVISGGARGIDTAAHQGCLRGGGRTIAVVGCGLDIIYPSENRSLFENIAQQGAVITQFPFGRKADRQTFPIRNRIVAGMSLGTVVIEANKTSGALITANMAVDNGRQVFAVPGRIDSPRSKGCHVLIKNGAKLCESVEDILGEFEYLFPPPSNCGQPGDSAPATMPVSEEEAVLWRLVEDQECHIDELVRASGWPVEKVSVLLMAMELKGLVKRMPGQVYRQGRE